MSKGEGSSTKLITCLLFVLSSCEAMSYCAVAINCHCRSAIRIQYNNIFKGRLLDIILQYRRSRVGTSRHLRSAPIKQGNGVSCLTSNSGFKFILNVNRGFLPGMPWLLCQTEYQVKKQVWGPLPPKRTHGWIDVNSLHFADLLCRYQLVFATHVGLVLFQDYVSRELGLRYGRKLFNDVLQGLQPRHPQLVTVVCGRHEGHADEVGQVEHQLIAWMDKGGTARINWGRETILI